MSDSKNFLDKLQNDPAMQKKAKAALDQVAKDAGMDIDSSDLDSVAGGGGSCKQYAWTAGCSF